MQEKIKEYDIPLNLVMSDFSVDYYGCGSHKIEITGTTDLEYLQTLYNYLKTVSGIIK